MTLQDDVIVTFKKRSMYTLVLEGRIIKALDADNIDMDVEKILANNFAQCMARTESITCKDDASENAWQWADFWESAQGRIDYEALFFEYLQLDLDVNYAWVEAYNQNELNEAGRGDPELGTPETVPPDVLQDETVKKNAETQEPLGENEPENVQ